MGAFLSGGVDSSLIVAMMQEQSSSPVKTFTIGFEDSNFDESPYAKEVAKHLGTNHEEYFVTASETLDVIPKLPNIYDEPFADSSQIPTYLVCKEAKKMVTVALSGDGGDELFGGYNRYFWSARVWQQVKWMPLKIRKFLGFSISMTPDIFWDSAGAVYNFLTPNDKGISMISDKAKKMGLRMQSIASEDDLYLSLVSQWEDTDNLLQDFDKQENQINLLADNNIEDAPSRMMFWDSLTYLPDDILCKVDRASMAVSLETRAPFLDHRLIELAWQLDPSLKIDDKIGKKILRSILDEYVPRNLIDRPKAGFGIPVGSWLRGPLKSWAEELIDENRIKTEGYFNYEPIRLIWRQHLSGRFDHTHKLWSILMFQSWLETQ